MKKITAVILAAGRGTRLLPLTATVPKPIIKIVGKTPLEHNLDHLVGHVDEAVIVVNYLKEEIIKFIGTDHKGLKIKYVFQKNPQGTGHALFEARKKVDSDGVLVMNGDDVYSEDLILKTLNLKNAVVGKREKNWKNYGVLKINNKSLSGIEEKPEKFVGNLVNIGLYKFNKEIFSCFKKIRRSSRGEYEITDMINEYVRKHTTRVISCNSGWRPIGYPWDTLSFAENELEHMKSDIKGSIEKNAVVKGKLVLGKNSVIRSGSYLEGNFYIGENCEIGPNCYIKGFGSIDNGTNVGNAVEIARSVIGERTNIKHLSYIGDSIIGNGVNIGAGTIVANLRHDDRPVKVMVNGKLKDTGKRKFGVVIGDNVKTGSHTTFYPGTKLEAGDYTLPGEVVKYGH